MFLQFLNKSLFSGEYKKLDMVLTAWFQSHNNYDKSIPALFWLTLIGFMQHIFSIVSNSKRDKMEKC